MREHNMKHIKFSKTDSIEIKKHRVDLYIGETLVKTQIAIDGVCIPCKEIIVDLNIDTDPIITIVRTVVKDNNGLWYTDEFLIANPIVENIVADPLITHSSFFN